MAKIHALYSRVSTDAQRDKGLSIPRQKEWLENEAKNHGFQRIEHFVDNGYSASSTNRPDFQRLLASVKEGLIETIFVYKFDRLARNVQDLLAFVDLLNKHGVKFVSVSEHLDTTTPTGRLILTVLGSLAEWERGITVSRVKDVMYDKVRKGNFCGGQPPYGYDVKDKKLAINETEAQIVRKIFAKFEEWRSFRKLVIWLNDKGYTTKRGRSWPAETVKRILGSHVYKGYYTYGKRAGGSKVYLPQKQWEIHRGDFDPIISEEQFERVQVLIRQRHFTRPVRGGVVYLLSGLLHCKECGGALCGHAQRKPSGKIYSSYRCHQHMSKGNRACSGLRVNKAQLEQEVIEKLRQTAHLHFEEAEAQEMLATDAAEEAQDDVKSIEMAISRLKNKQQKLLTLFEDDAIAREEVVERMQENATELDRLQVRRQDLVAEADPQAKNKRTMLLQQIKDWDDDFSNRSERTKQTILQQLIKQVIVGKQSDIEIELYDL